MPYYPAHLYAIPPGQPQPTPSYPRPSASSYSVPFPTLSNVTAAVVNATPSNGGRKRKNAISASGAPPAKKRIVSRPSSTSAASAIPIGTAETTCGVGPSRSDTPVHPQPTESATPSLTPSTAVPTQLDGPQTEKKILGERTTDKKAATDVWFFVEPLPPGAEAPTSAISVPDIASMKALISRKPDAEKFPRVRCRLCSEWTTFSNKDGITTTLRRHLKSDTFHLAIYDGITKIFGLKHADRSTLSHSDTNDEPFTVQGWLDRLVRWVVIDDQSINLVDIPEFRDFALFGREDVSEKDLPHRKALTTLIAATYEKQRVKLDTDILDALGRISHTADIWSDGNLRSYMALSEHYMCREENGHLVIKSSLIAFRIIEGAHDGEHLANVIYGIWKEHGILLRLGQFTLDNAGNNNTTLRFLVELLKKDGIDYSEDGNRVRCFPHVINIATQTVLKELEENPTFPILEYISKLPADSVEHHSANAYLDALEAKPITKFRNMVAACRKSGQRRSDLATVIVNGNDTDQWDLRVVQLLRDCETRWSSTHLMIGRVLELYEAVATFLKLPKQIDLTHLLSEQAEYQALHDIQYILSVPHAAQELLSAEKTPTLSMALPAYEMVITAWLKIQKENPILSHYIGVGIYKLQEYVALGRKSRIYAIAMIINPEVKMEWIQKHWSADESKNAKEWMISAMTSFATARRHSLMVSTSRLQRSATEPIIQPKLRQPDAAEKQTHGLDRLSNIGSTPRRMVSLPGIASASPRPPNSSGHSRTPSALPPVPSSTPAAPALTEAEKAEQEKQALIIDHFIVEKEFEKYIALGLEKGIKLVRYWDLHEKELPLLFSVAMDVLPVQASAVPCERVFSSSKETTTLRRSRLSTGLMEMLQVLKYSFKQDRLNFTEDWIAREEDYTINGSVTEAAARELMLHGNFEELFDLFTTGDTATTI